MRSVTLYMDEKSVYGVFLCPAGRERAGCTTVLSVPAVLIILSIQVSRENFDTNSYIAI